MYTVALPGGAKGAIDPPPIYCVDLRILLRLIKKWKSVNKRHNIVTVS